MYGDAGKRGNVAESPRLVEKAEGVTTAGTTQRTVLVVWGRVVPFPQTLFDVSFRAFDARGKMSVG
jgi:hypothetical protein